ncbi:NADAR family protein [Paenibacillus chitinolyticus]|uniref:hypothetical protein n=1 Tax=Paenibacillus chitinolyticus TaxID=79263 RepID=UPI00367138D1
MIDPLQDGVSHINIYSQGKTELGKMLSNFTKCDILTKEGQFSSVEGYWYWLGIEDCSEKEVLRSLSGYQAKRIGSELKKKYQTKKDEEFQAKILRSIWEKVKKNSHMFRSETAALPFEHYYNYGGKIVDVKDKYIWLINGIDKIRKFVLSKI